MPDIYWRHRLYEGARAYKSAWTGEGQYSVPKAMFEELGEPFDRPEDKVVYVCVVHNDKVWAARSISAMPAQNTDRVLINCVDVSNEIFAKEILMRKLLSS